MDWAQARRYALTAWRRFRRWPTRWQAAGWIFLLLLVGSIGDAFDGGTTTSKSETPTTQPASSFDKAAERRSAAAAERRELTEARRQRRARAARQRQRARERKRREAERLAAQAPPPVPEPEPEPASNCDSNYSGCVPIASDVDCGGGSGDGPAYLDGTVTVLGSDVYGLDSDSDGTACE